MLEYLLLKGAVADIDAMPSVTAQTPLFLAMHGKNFAAAEILIRHGANVNARMRSPSTTTALATAVGWDRPGLAELLVAQGADVQERLSNGRTLLCRAKSARLRSCSFAVGVDVCERDQDERSPLDHSVEEGHLDVARTLIRHGAHPSFFDYVALGDRERVLEMLDRQPELIQAYNRPDGHVPRSARTENSFEVPLGSLYGTALHYAVKSGVAGTVKMLLDFGADVNAATEPQKWTPLHDATYYTIYLDLPHGAEIIRMLVGAALT